MSASQGSELLASLKRLCPRLMPSSFPRGFAGNLEDFEKINCPDHISNLKESMSRISDCSRRCSVCKISDLKSNCDVNVSWLLDFHSGKWIFKDVYVCCKSCAAACSLESMLNTMLAVDDEYSEIQFSELCSHFQIVNELDDPQALQLALNLSHAIKVLASNLRLQVVDATGKPLSPSALAKHAATLLSRHAATHSDASAAGDGGGPAARRASTKSSAPAGSDSDDTSDVDHGVAHAVAAAAAAAAAVGGGSSDSKKKKKKRKASLSRAADGCGGGKEAAPEKRPKGRESASDSASGGGEAAKKKKKQPARR